MDRPILKIREKKDFKIKLIVMLIVVIMIFIAAVYAAASRYSEPSDIISATVNNMENPVYLSIGNNDSYIITQLDENNKVEKRIHLPRNNGENRMEYFDVVVDSYGNFYIKSAEYDTYGKYVSYYTSKYDKNGNFLDVLFKIDLQADEKNINGLQYINGTVVSFKLVQPSRMVIMHYNIETMESWETTYEFSKMYNVNEILYDGRGGVYFTTIDSHLYYIEDDGTLIEINLPTETVVYKLSIDTKNNILYFNDIHWFKFYAYYPEMRTIEQIYNFSDEIKSGVKFGDVREYAFKNDCFVSEASDFITGKNFISIEGTNNYIISRERNSSAEITVAFFIMLGSIVVTIAVLGIIIYLWKYSKKLIIKIVLPMILIMIVSTLIITNIFKNFMLNTIENEVYSQLYTMSSSIAKGIDGDELKRQVFPQTRESDFYKTVSGLINIQMENFYNEIDTTIIKDFYYTLYYMEDGSSYIGFDIIEDGSENLSGTLEEYSVGNSNTTNSYLNNKDKTKVVLLTTSDLFGEWMICPTSIYDSNGETVGYIEIGTERTIIESGMNSIIFKVSIATISVMLVLLIVFIVLLRRLLKGIGILRDGVNTITDGNWNTTVEIKSNDEIEDIGNAFNKMSFRIKRYLDSLIKLNKACKRFIPDEFFEIIGRKNIIDINVGDQKIRNMNIVSITTQNFYEIAKEMDNEQQFAFLNNMFAMITGVIEESGGIIESYQGAGLRVIFNENPDKAVEACLKIFEKISRYNKESKNNIDLMITIQNDDAMLGIVGDESRMSTAIISESVNFIYELEKFTKKNGIRFLITKDVYEKLEHAEKYNFRYIGRIAGETNSRGFIEVFDCIDACDIKEREQRNYTKTKFENGVNEYIRGNLHEARKCFIDTIRINHTDKLTQTYIFLCDQKKYEKMDNWQGFLT